MKEILIAGIIGGLLLSSGLVKADQVIFSQYDGVNTWNNVYVEIEDAKAFADANPGVAFAKPTAHIETQAVEEVKAVQGSDGKWVITTVSNISSSSGHVETWNQRQGETKWTSEDYSYTIATPFGNLVIDVPSATKTEPVVSSRGTTVSKVDTVNSVTGVKGKAYNVEQAMQPRAIVSVPTGVDIDLFIKQFMEK